MRKLLGLLLIAAIAASCSSEKQQEESAMPEAQAPASSIHEQFSWLEGTWVRETSNGISYEVWSADDSGLFGLSFRVNAVDTTVTERLRLLDDDGEIYFVAHPKQNDEPTRFLMTERDSLSVTFENPEHDFPTRITYFNKPPDSMVASIAGPSQDGMQTIDFPFKRQK